MDLPLTDGSEYNLTSIEVKQYQETYVNLNVAFELNKARQWLLDNPKRRKTEVGMPRFITGWLNRAKPTAMPQHPASHSYFPKTEPVEKATQEQFEQHVRNLKGVLGRRRNV